MASNTEKQAALVAVCSGVLLSSTNGKVCWNRLLRILAKEIGEDQITVNQVAPGWTVGDRDRLAATEHNEDYER